MTLLDFIRSSDFTFASFAEAIGETENIVRKWAYRQRQPSLPRVVKIEIATRGMVTARELLIAPAEAE
jgi:DNA-binding transcriptional regulator YdaS (Cro superfamily)